MKTLILWLIVGIVIWGGYRHYYPSQGSASTLIEYDATQPGAVPPRFSPPPAPAREEERSIYTCDGRQHCSQMRSCEEAKYFLEHCPDTKMDGDGDGVPCEGQWCGN
jgi:hypothetical protein